MKTVDRAALKPGPSFVWCQSWRVGWLLLALSALIGCGGKHSAEESARFLEKVKSAYVNESVSELLELYAWEGVPSGRQRSIRVALEFEIDLPIRTMKIRPVASVREMEDHLAGGSLRPNLPPEFLFWIEFETSERLSYSMLVGRNANGDLRFIVGVPVEEIPSGARPDGPIR